MNYWVHDDPEGKTSNSYVFVRNGEVISYTFVHKIGKGGIAHVFLVKDETTSEDVILRKIYGRSENDCHLMIEAIEQVNFGKGHSNLAKINNAFLYKSIKQEVTLYVTMVRVFLNIN
jgi:hypothetical protein